MIISGVFNKDRYGIFLELNNQLNSILFGVLCINPVGEQFGSRLTQRSVVL